MRYEIRPVVQWTDQVTEPRRGSHLFRATWKATLELLSRELDYLDAAQPVVFQIDVTEADLRLDGMLRANAKVGLPCVIISFQSRYGPLRYATDTYEQQYGYSLPGWQANVRAIALALEALRSVDRWGVTKRGEQYTGWKALPASNGHAAFATAFAAATWMRETHATLIGLHGGWLTEMPLSQTYRALAKRMHPDAPGGSPADWERLDTARQLLETAGML